MYIKARSFTMKSTRVTITRPNTTIQWPFEIFLDQTKASADAHLAMLPAIEVKSYIKGGDTLTAIVDHTVSDNAVFDANRDLINSEILWWEPAENAEACHAYMVANGLTSTITEVTDPDLSDAIDITELRSTSLI
jgi:hypothetical protein